MSIFLYACESWTLNADIKRRIRAMEMRCYRRLLGIFSYKDHITNEEVKRRIENAIGPHVDLLTIVRQRKLKWYGHTIRSSGLAKTIMQGTVNGGRRRGPQKKRWEDNIREWTELELRNTLRKAEDREEWKAVVRRSSAGPRRIPNLLRDRG
ncbi:endonuclease-reverse transcriptase [Plakobranchus ocellatus]|uniref:Endonuclease-reverse transcriptase n=1 Tax=Plakobranchus ocellatus TaxID=259542 RepID=A0AAV4C7X9_9GAST|nr:endonuclease-reverse transcriptase [Plakobranchus ocellatus]